MLREMTDQLPGIQTFETLPRGSLTTRDTRIYLCCHFATWNACFFRNDRTIRISGISGCSLHVR
jgi:hypothetical protein